MKTIFVNRFDGGIGDSNYTQTPGTFSIAKHFDINTYPNRLVPHRAVESDSALADATATAGIGNFLVASSGLVYALGTDEPGNPTKAEIYKKPDSTTAWTPLASNRGLTGNNILYNLFVEYKNNFYLASADLDEIDIIDRTESIAVTHHTLAFTNIAQGVVNPKDDILYIPYDNKIAKLDNTTWTDTALTLPSYLTITSIVPYGNWLAIAAVPTAALTISPSGGGFKSSVYLWDRSATTATLTEVIDWGTGVIRVLNVLDGILIGVSSSNGATTEFQDRDSIVIKGYNLGTPFLIKEISTTKQTTTSPVAVINPRVNFIYRDKMYVSLKIFGGSTSPTHYGVFTIAKSKVTGQHAVNLERMATNDATETDVLAAAAVGEVFYTVHTAVGTVTRSVNESAFASVYAATSLYESTVNPNMPLNEYYQKKQLDAVACYYLPLIASASVTMYYRVDGGSWTSIFTDSTDNSTGFEMPKAGSTEFTAGRQYEFKIESTGGANPIGFAYKYHSLTNLL